MDFPELLVGNMRINLGGGNGRMPKHALNAADVRPVHQQIRGIRMPEGMRGDFFGNAGSTGIMFH